jgi:putative phosphoribosyl transferase
MRRRGTPDTARSILPKDPDTVVLGLPRGGIPVAREVAERLSLPLDVFVVRKLGVPWNEEVAFGAIATGGVRVLDPAIIATCGVTADDIARITTREQEELSRRDALYREGAPPPRLAGKTVILVDDGVATGASMAAAVDAVRAQHPARVIVAVPVVSTDGERTLRARADGVVAVLTPASLNSVGEWYAAFAQVSDAEVRHLLARDVAPTEPSGAH